MNPAKSTFNLSEFKIKNSKTPLIFAILFFLLLCFSIFKNISYPLFWADESMTAIGSERVLEFGYPKVHDGKNIFYDLRHSNQRLGINEKDDAYIGGTGWGHYYYGIIGYKLAELTPDIYFKTGIFRATFAVAGILGLLLITFFISGFFTDPFTKFTFVALFFLLELMSVSLALLLREVRYYSLVILLSSIIIGLYLSFRFNKPFNKIAFTIIESLSLCLLFITFSPVFFISVATIGVSELLIAIVAIYRSSFETSFRKSLPVLISLFIACLLVFPLLIYFKTFEISRAMNEFNNFNKTMYWNNLKTILNYFKNFEFLAFVFLLKIFLLFEIKKLILKKPVLLKVSFFLSLFFVVSVFSLANIPNFIFTRYIIYLQPFLALIVCIDFLIITDQILIEERKYWKIRFIIPTLLFAGMIVYNLTLNSQYIKGHLYEITHIFKGPLDFTIPFIKDKYPVTDNLVIATNYEETSYMYYLKSKAIVGFTGNNLAQDINEHPDILIYRKAWGEYVKVFDEFWKKASYERKAFPIFDSPFNNIPELNFIPAFNHQFKTNYQLDQANQTNLFFRKIH